MGRIEAPQGFPMQAEEVERYVVENTIPLNLRKRTCGDGRYLHGEGDGGRMASFGADLGKILPLLDFGFSPQDATDLVVGAVTNIDDPRRSPSFYLHNERGKPRWRDLNVIGCGHASVNASSALEEVMSYLEQLRSKKSIEITTLRGAHKEEALVINLGITQTIRPTDGERMVFVHDQLGEELFVRQILFEGFERQGFRMTEVDKQNYMTYLRLHSRRTIETLASRIPTFTINADLNPPFVFWSVLGPR